MPQVSVIIPTYKHRDFVLATLDSIFAQTFTDYEVIVINDGSPDDTAGVLNPLAEAGRIRYIKQANQGQAAARNRGLTEAQGEFIAFLDDDDLWPSDKLEWQLKALLGNPSIVFVCGSVSLVSHDFDLENCGSIQQNIFAGDCAVSGLVHEDFLKQNWLHSPGQALFRAETIRDIGGFDENLWGSDDYDLYIRLAERGLVARNNYVSLYYRQHTTNASKNIKRMYRNICAVRRKHLGRLPRWKNRDVWMANYHFWHQIYLTQAVDAAFASLTQGDKQKAKRFWVEALQMSPGRHHCRRMLSLFCCLWLKPLL